MTSKTPSPAETLQEAKRAASAVRKQRRDAMDAEYNAAVAAAYVAYQDATMGVRG